MTKEIKYLNSIIDDLIYANKKLTQDCSCTLKIGHSIVSITQQEFMENKKINHRNTHDAILRKKIDEFIK